MTDITVIILTKDEELNIRRCINSIKNLADRIIVVDSGSKDRTVEISKKLGAEVFEHPFIHYAAQFNWALDNTKITTTWVYRIDADEYVTPELSNEILRKCKEHRNDDVTAFLMKHKLYFLGKYLKHGGAYPFIKITIFKPQYARFEERAMGEHVVPLKGRCLQFTNDCIHYDCKNLTTFIDKHNKYATREVIDYFERRKKKKNQAALYQAAERTKWLRDGLYYKLPKFFRARLYFLFCYYIKLGFLDGKAGKIYAWIQAYMYRYIVDAKIVEQEINEKEKLENES